MAKREFVDMIVKPVPEALKAAIEALAADDGVSASGAAVSILADEFKIDYEAPQLSRVVPKQERNPTQLYLTSMPRKLRKAIMVRAAQRESDASAIARDVLCAHFGIVEAAAA